MTVDHDMENMLKEKIEELKKQNKELKEENNNLHTMISNATNWYYGEVGYIDTERLERLRDILEI